jgi:hypothetical protein
MYNNDFDKTLATSSTGSLSNGIRANGSEGEALEMPLGGVI